MRYLSAFFAFLLLFSVVAFCAVPPHSVVEDGKTIIRTFKLSDQPKEVVDMFEGIISSDRNVLVSWGTYQYRFFVIPSGVTVNFTQGDSYSPVVMRFSAPVQYMSFDRDGEYLVYSGAPTVEALPITLVCAGNYLEGYTCPPLFNDYIAEVTGTVVLEWDTQTDKPNNGGILDWLTDFWNKFVDTLKGLFVPSEDYFSNFFTDIKNAFDLKLGGIGALLGSLSDAFDDLGTVNGKSSLVIDLPDNFLFRGYSGLSVDILKPFSFLISFVRGIFNSFLVVTTIIICYRKVIAIVNV